MSKKFFDKFDGISSIEESYQVDTGLTEDNIHFAYYGYADQYGYSIVAFDKDGELYLVSGSHWESYGLEGQWEPEPTSWASLSRIDNPYYIKELEALKQSIRQNLGDI